MPGGSWSCLLQQPSSLLTRTLSPDSHLADAPCVYVQARIPPQCNDRAGGEALTTAGVDNLHHWITLLQ